MAPPRASLALAFLLLLGAPSARSEDLRSWNPDYQPGSPEDQPASPVQVPAPAAAPAPAEPEGEGDFRRHPRSRRRRDPPRTDDTPRDPVRYGDPRYADAYVAFFNRLMRQASRDPRLRALLEGYAARYRNDPDAYDRIGSDAYDAGAYGPALAAYTQALDAGARTPDVYYGRALAADALGDHEFAVLDAKQAYALDPEDKRAFAFIKLTDGRRSTARVDAASGEARSTLGATTPAAAAAASPAPPPGAAPTSPALAADARRRLSLGDPAGALKAALAAAAADPKDAEAQNLLATAYEKNGRHEEAEAAADSALALAPDSVPTLNTRSWARSGSRKFSDALGDARRILELSPGNAFGLVAEARALGGLGRRDEMIDALSQAAARDGRFGELRGRAVRLPREADTELLFTGGPEAAAPAAPRRSNRRFLVMLASTVSGGLLLALGLLHVFSPSWRERVTGRVRGGAPAARGKHEELPRLGALEVKRLIASGGMGVVYEGWDAGLRRKVALKRLRGEIRDDAKERARFLGEARAVAALEHPNIVRIYSVLEEGGELCLVFEYAEGLTLRDAVAKEGALAPERALALAGELCAGLGHAHAEGLIHRDLKPENVMVGPKGAKLMDFGLARPPRDAASSTTVWGSPPFMAPEAEDGEANTAGDLYSLGATLYYALVGKPPFHGTPGALARAKGKGDFVQPSKARKGLPAKLDGFMARALNPDPAERFSDAREFHAALAKALA
ncbi:MAG: protein kinase [Elusimicrobia bacterium]|nr:protein kinase [Elusimicrobiota bacterium]